MRKYRASHPQYVQRGIKNRQKWRSLHLQQDKDSYRKYHHRTHQHQLQRCVEYNNSQKLRVLKHYTKNTLQCCVCNEKRYECLTIHHKNYNGTILRKRYDLKGGIDFYNWIIAHRYPKNLEIRCYNCNCPHKFKHPSKYILYRNKIKKDVFEHYSQPPKCSTCALQNLDLLIIDHVNGGGRQHFKSLKRHGGTSFYIWLKKNNYPPGFQILCYNCNSTK